MKRWGEFEDPIASEIKTVKVSTTKIAQLQEASDKESNSGAQGTERINKK